MPGSHEAGFRPRFQLAAPFQKVVHKSHAVVHQKTNDNGKSNGNSHTQQWIVVDPPAGKSSHGHRIAGPRHYRDAVQHHKAAPGKVGGARREVDSNPSHGDVPGSEYQHGSAFFQFPARPSEGLCPTRPAHPMKPRSAQFPAHDVRNVVPNHRPDRGTQDQQPNIWRPRTCGDGSQGHDGRLAGQEQEEAIDQAKEADQGNHPPLCGGMFDQNVNLIDDVQKIHPGCFLPCGGRLH